MLTLFRAINVFAKKKKKKYCYILLDAIVHVCLLN